MISVIIADDDYSVCHGLANHILWEELDAEVIMLAENGAEVLKKLAETDVDLIISDIRMPVMDGLELLRYMHKNGMTVNTILLSAYAEFEYAQEAISLGVREYITKPITREKLNRIENFVRRVAAEKKMTERVMFEVYDPEFRKRFLEAVAERDRDAVEEFLVIDSSFSNLVLYKEYCLALTKMMPDITAEDKNSQMALLVAATNISECKHLMLEKILKQPAKREHTKEMQTVESIIAYVNDNYPDSNLNVQSIATHFGLSPGYVSTLFKAENGSSLSDWITTCRISKSGELLSATGKTIQQIANEVGYDDMRYFMRLFKKRMGLTPTQYRTKVQREAEV